VNEPELTPELAGQQLFGTPPKPGPSKVDAEPQAEPEPESKVDAEPQGDAETAKPSNEDLDPEQAHSALVADWLRGSPTKREADRRFFESLSGPTKAGDEWVRSSKTATTRC
jgi:hypothetical protein